MAFTFSADLSTTVSIVRFHIGDTNSDGYYLDDATITYWYTQTGDIGQTVVACIKYIITQLSFPDFKLDWLSVSNKEARIGFENLLKLKKQELGVTESISISSTTKKPYRADSYQDNTEDYDGNP